MWRGTTAAARVAYRLALDHPKAVRRLAVLDIVPTLDVWEQMNWQSALSTYHWPFLAVPAPVPEKLIGSDPVFYLHHLLQRWAGEAGLLRIPTRSPPTSAASRSPSVIQASCEDYRAGASIDVELDRADRKKGRRIACPVLALWGKGYLKDKIDSPPRSGGTGPRTCARWRSTAAISSRRRSRPRPPSRCASSSRGSPGQSARPSP